MKRTLAVPFAIAAAMVAFFPGLTPAFSQTLSVVTYVSTEGNDANGCGPGDPCGTIPGALAKTATNGVVFCEPPVNFSFERITITKSVTIDCHEAPALLMLDGASQIIQINFDLFASNDTLKTVTLRNLTLNGFDNDFIGIEILGAGA